MKYTTFPTTVGVEYSFVPEVVGNWDVRAVTSELAADALRNDSMLPQNVRWKIHQECHAVEVPSPVHLDEGKLEQFARRLFTSARERYLTPRLILKNKSGVESYVGTGGGHVHVGIPRRLGREKRALFLHNVAIDTANRPEMNWFFQEWLDNDTLPHLMVRNLRKWHRPLSSESIAEYCRSNRDVPIAIRGKKKYSRKRLNTLEFRLFDAPRNVEMVKKNVDFALAYCEYHKALAKKGRKVRLYKRNILERTKLTPEQVQGRLRRLFRKIGLSYKDYHETYWPNYELRAEHGKL